MSADPSDVSARLASLEQFRPRLLRAARRYAPSPHDAQDAVQEALLRVAGVDEVDWDRVEGLLVTVLRNICIDQIRASQRRMSRDDRYARAADTASEGDAEEVCDRAEAAWFRQKLGTLIPQERRILEQLAEGQPLVDIARSEGISYKAAHSSLSRARKVLVTMWQATLSLFTLSWARKRTSATPLFGATAFALTLAISVAPFLHLMQPRTRPGTAPIEHVRAVTEEASSQRISAHQVATTTQPLRPTAKHEFVVVPDVGSRHGVKPFTPVTVTRESRGEALREAAVRCLRAGVVVSVEYTGCKQ